MDIKYFHAKNQLFVAVNCLVENPAFDSQTKDTLTTKVSQFGSTCVLSEAFLNRIAEQTGIVETLVNFALLKQKSELVAAGTARNRHNLNIPKLDDANWAGGPNSRECTLIITEGDSAKALAVAGLSILGR